MTAPPPSAPPPPPPAPGPGEPGDGPEERDPGLAGERTALAWTRTAIAFAALGGVVLKENVVTGLIVLAIAPVIWQLGRMSRGGSLGTDVPAPGVPAAGAARLFLIAASIVAVAVVCLFIAVFGRSVPGGLR